MKNMSGARLAAAVLIAGSCPAMAVPAGPSLKTLPLQQDIWIGGTIQQGNGQYAPGDYTTLLLDRPAASPCDDKVVTDILLGNFGATDPKLLRTYLGQHVAVRGRVICPDSGIRFTPTPDFVFPVY
ncbi:hypothetical protein [Paraburkholderia sp. BL9I2N2]|uniref:hypothetical protein n=2 Tax=unclassified Paraburkholderia TaxID=2615204 RepID=UPI0010D5751B|nr:hypothetical protein B0G74_6855 [Paraburkholderia sp. BL9I2N2]